MDEIMESKEYLDYCKEHNLKSFLIISYYEYINYLNYKCYIEKERNE